MTIQFECGVDIRCRPERVFALLDDVSQTPRWLTSCQAMEKLTPGPNAVGTKLRYVYKDALHTSVMLGSITARTANQELSFEYSDQRVSVAAQFQLTEISTGTHLQHRIEIAPKTFVVRMLSPVIRRQLAEQTRSAIASLQKLLEHEAPSEAQ